MEIKRYSIHWNQQEEIEDPEGEFVRYEDHIAKCDELGTVATSASDELFKLIESMKPRPIDDNTPRPHWSENQILVKHRTMGWIQVYWHNKDCEWQQESGSIGFSDDDAEAWLPLPTEVKPWSDSPDQDKFIDMESGEVK